MPKPIAKPARRSKPGHDDVVHLAGNLDDAVVSAILDTGASYKEIEEAVTWAAGNAEQFGKEGRTLSPTALAVYDILMAEPGFLPPSRER